MNLKQKVPQNHHNSEGLFYIKCLKFEFYNLNQ